MDDAGAAIQIEVNKYRSVDVRVPANGFVFIEDPDTPVAEIEGVYDLVGTEVAVRSGRFRSKTPNTNPVPIIKRKAGLLYRVFNSGEKPFFLEAYNPTSLIEPKCSRDISLANVNIVRVKSSADQQIAGVYDSLVEIVGAVRSGRFEFTETATPVEHLLIDLANATKNYVYRISNAGEESFDVFKTGSAKLATLAQNQSVDIQISSTVNTQITVKGGADKTITGIYDFLGPA